MPLSLMPPMPASAPGLALVLAGGMLTALPLRAQDVDVPRTHTVPGIDAPAFPYAAPEEVGLSSATLDRLGDEITGWVANGELVGAELLIVKDGRAVFHEAFGWSDREAGEPVERNSIWSIKSMSKPFTATAVLMLAEEGRLSLDDPASHYIPGFAGDDRTTIHHLLSHTSGYRNEDLGDPTADHASLREWVEEWAAVTPTGTFGEYEYTDFGFAAAGYIVEQVTGVPIGPFTEQRIVEPLRLEDTSTTFSDDPAWRARLNPWYIWSDAALRYDLRWAADRTAWSFYPAAWGMFSTAMDYAGFMAMWLNGGEWNGARLLSEATVAEALRPQGLRDGRGAYGYGWVLDAAVNEDGTPVVFSHGGGDGTLALAFPADDAMVIFLTHSRDGPHLGALRSALAMLDIFDYPGPEFIRVDAGDVEEVELSPDEQAQYVGVYSGRAGIDYVAHVWQEQGRLHLRLGVPGGRADYWRWHLVSLGDHLFAPGRYGDDRLRAIHPGLRARFRVENGQATVLDIAEGDQMLISTRRDDPVRILAEVEAKRSRVSIADVVLEIMETDGVAAARQRHRALLASTPDSVRIDEPLLNLLGYRLMGAGRVAEAIAVFEMNVEAYPNAPNPHDSLGDGYAAAGRLEEARRSYQRAVDLAEQQGHEGLAAYRANLERVVRELEGKQL